MFAFFTSLLTHPVIAFFKRLFTVIKSLFRRGKAAVHQSVAEPIQVCRQIGDNFKQASLQFGKAAGRTYGRLKTAIIVALCSALVNLAIATRAFAKSVMKNAMTLHRAHKGASHHAHTDRTTRTHACAA